MNRLWLTKSEDEKLREWAKDNCRMLIVMALGFVITWLIMVVYGIYDALD